MVKRSRRLTNLNDDDAAWPRADVAKLKQLVATGMSYARMAKRLKRTRNQVIGKVHRLHLRAPATPDRVASDNATLARIANFRTQMGYRIQAEGAATTLERANVMVFRPKGGLIPLEKLTESSCRWPIGDPREKGFGFCGCPKVAESSYCVNHERVAYETETSNPRLERLADVVEPKPMRKVA